MPKAFPLLLAFVATALVALAGGCPAGVGAGDSVVVYCSLDAEPAGEIFRAFTASTGIRVVPKFDTEAEKNLGPVRWLIDERESPRADVFLNGETSATVRLKREGLLAAYESPQALAGGRAARYLDAEGFYSIFALRARVIVYDPDATDADALPTSMQDVPAFAAAERFAGRVAVSNPHTGSHAAQAAAMTQAWGGARMREWYTALRDAGVHIKPGNMAVVDAVARGEAAWGLTDTDDVFGARAEGRNVAFVVPDDTVVFGASVALVCGAPHAEAARRFIDFVLGPDGERILAAGRARHLPIRSDVEAPAGWPALESVNALAVDWSAIEPARAEAAAIVRDVFAAD